MSVQTNTIIWGAPADHMCVRQDQVHIWYARLDQPLAQIAQLQQTLSRDEQRRALHFRFDADRVRFIATRGILRTILSRYSAVAPRALQLGYGSYGKPFLENARAAPDLQFNVAHAQQIALYAVTRQRRVGIDVEGMHRPVNYHVLAPALFSEHAYQSFCALPLEHQPEAFFTCWTRKEAYIKARGDGLAYPLNQFDVSFLPHEAPALRLTQPDPREADRWSLYHLVPSPGYLGALAVEGTRCSIRYIAWQSMLQ